ncbi:MAG: A/G-specific adenine glycosylase [Sphingorhabdus sp.]
MNGVQPDRQKAGEISARLLAHYDVHARDLPWRVPPAQSSTLFPDPYHVWLSEIMLQQTTVAAVIPYFAKFTARWPDIAALARAEEADVMAAWAGLGYYARARNLIACAKLLMADHGGVFPQDEAGLLKLPGIGPYTASAISAIAFGKRAVVVDANIERVIARLFAIGTPLPAGKAEIRAAMNASTPAKRAGDFAQAMMDLGAAICRVKSPACPSCPLLGDCAAYQQGKSESYPVKPAKKARRRRTGTAYWIERGGHVWLAVRPGSGMLGGMRALPDDGWRAGKDGDGEPPVAANWRILDAKVAHVFTHFSLSLSIAVTDPPVSEDALPRGEWWPLKSLDKAGLPTLFFKAARIAMARRAMARSATDREMGTNGTAA